MESLTNKHMIEKVSFINNNNILKNHNLIVKNRSRTISTMVDTKIIQKWLIIL